MPYGAYNARPQADNPTPQFTEGETLVGQVRSLREGFGFITVPNVSRDFFFHKTDLRGVQFHELVLGATLTFTATADPQKAGRLRAVDVARG